MQIMEITDNVVSESIINLDSSITIDPEVGDERPSFRGYHGEGPCFIMFNRRGTSIASAVVGIFVVAVLKGLLWDW